MLLLRQSEKERKEMSRRGEEEETGYRKCVEVPMRIKKVRERKGKQGEAGEGHAG